MASTRREITTDLAPSEAGRVVADLTGPGHWGRAIRTFHRVGDDDGPVRVGTRLTTTTRVHDEVLGADVVVVRHDVGPSGSRLVLRSENVLGSATESLLVVAAGRRGTLVEHQVTVDSGVGDAPMLLWLGRFADVCRDGITDALEASGS